MAASGNLLMELKISFTATSMFASATTMPTTLASPMDTAIETEIAKQAIIVMSMAVVIFLFFQAFRRGLLRGFQLVVARVQIVADHTDHGANRTHRQSKKNQEHGNKPQNQNNPELAK